MMTTLRAMALGLAGLFLACPAAAAEPDAPLRYHALGQGLLYVTWLRPAESRFNPARELAPIAPREADAELRLNLGASLGACSASAKLRGRYHRNLDAGSAAWPADGREGFLNEGGVRCRAGNNAELGAGREVLQWGSSFFLSPSNPFFSDTGKTNPIQELYGKDMLHASWFPDPAVSVALLRNYGHGRLEPDAADFSPVSALQVDWIGDSASAGAIVSRKDNGVRRLGLYGTLPWSKALLLYADGSAGRGHAGWFALPDGAAATGWRLAQSKLDSDTLFHSALAGAAYTFESGWTVNLEWLNGNEGYSNAERQAVDSAAGAARPALLAHDAGSAAAAQLLGRALAPNLPYLGRNYLFLQLLRSEWNDKGDVALRVVRPLGAGAGAALSGSFTWYLGNHAQLFLVASHNFGGDGADFARLIRSSAQAGIRTSF